MVVKFIIEHYTKIKKCILSGEDEQSVWEWFLDNYLPKEDYPEDYFITEYKA